MSLEVFGYIAAIVMGLVLGLIGGGGSILTVPILVQARVTVLCVLGLFVSH